MKTTLEAIQRAVVELTQRLLVQEKAVEVFATGEAHKDAYARPQNKINVSVPLPVPTRINTRHHPTSLERIEIRLNLYDDRYFKRKDEGPLAIAYTLLETLQDQALSIESKACSALQLEDKVPLVLSAPQADNTYAAQLRCYCSIINTQP